MLVKGADYTRDKVFGADIVEAAAGRLVLLPWLSKSTTATISKMKA
jgi:bifunctional ADP-heptose synthase (sugar kinase/adenylyltransferase)